MTNKTREELEAEVAAQKAQIKDLNQEIARASKRERNSQSAADVYDIYQSYITAGFTEDQAWELITIMISKASM